MKRRALSLLLASATAAAFACGCGGKSSGSIIILDGEENTQTTVLTVYGHKTDRYSFSVIENVLQGFMSENGEITVAYEGAAKPDYIKALDRRYESGRLDDVFMIDSDRLVKMAADGVLCDLSASVNANIFDEIALSQINSFGNGVFAIPTSISTYGLYINYGLLEKNGRQVPRNLSEFTAVCDYFAGYGITPVACEGTSALRSLILSRGMYSTYCTADDTAEEIKKFNENPSALSSQLNGGIDFVYSMISRGTMKTEGGLDLFASGSCPFMIADSLTSSALKEKLSAEGRNISYGVHAYPILDTGSVLVAQADSMLSVKKGENEDGAKKIISLLSSPETLHELNYGQSCFSPLKQTPVNADPAIIPSASYLSKGKYVLGSDSNLKFPLDGILDECAAMIADGVSAETVKARLLKLLGEAGR